MPTDCPSPYIPFTNRLSVSTSTRSIPSSTLIILVRLLLSGKLNARESDRMLFRLALTVYLHGVEASSVEAILRRPDLLIV